MDQNTIEYLKNFKKLLNEGLITPEEFHEKKEELLSSCDLRDYYDSKNRVSSKQVLQEKSEVTSEKAPSCFSYPVNPGDLAFVVTGALFILVGLYCLGGFGFLLQIATLSINEAQLTLLMLTALGSLAVCTGLKGILAARDSTKK